MRVIRKYLESFRLAILLLVVAAVLWLYVPDNISNFHGSLIGTLLGVAISLFAAEGYKKIAHHRHVKRTFALLKLITIPYIKNVAQNQTDTLEQYRDICSVEQAVGFLTIAAQLDKLANNFDKSWLQLTYSADFVDAIPEDEHFNRISHAILEVLLFSKQLSSQAINAQRLLLNNVSAFTEDQKIEFLQQVRQIRDQLTEGATKLHEYVSKLDEEVTRFLGNNGASYSEVER